MCVTLTKSLCIWTLALTKDVLHTSITRFIGIFALSTSSLHLSVIIPSLCLLVFIPVVTVQFLRESNSKKKTILYATTFVLQINQKFLWSISYKSVNIYPDTDQLFVKDLACFKYPITIAVSGPKMWMLWTQYIAYMRAVFYMAFVMVNFCFYEDCLSSLQDSEPIKLKGMIWFKLASWMRPFSEAITILWVAKICWKNSLFIFN